MSRSCEVVIRGYQVNGTGLLIAYADGRMECDGEWRKVDVSDCLPIDPPRMPVWRGWWDGEPLTPRALGNIRATKCSVVQCRDGTFYVEVSLAPGRWFVWRPRNPPPELEAWALARRLRG